MKLKKGLRHPPPCGTVFAIPLLNGYFAHAVRVEGLRCWIYNFVTDGLTSDATLFSKDKLFQQFSMEHGGLSVKTVDELIISLDGEGIDVRFYWERLNEYEMEDANDYPPRPYLVRDTWEDVDMSKYRFTVTEEEIKKYPGMEHMGFGPKRLVEFIEEHLPEMSVVHLREDQRLVVTETAEPVETFEPGCVYEIWLSDIESMGFDSADDIKEELDDELEKHHAGEVIGTGGVDGQDQVNLAVQAAPGKDKQAITCIRRVLKARKANPETTDVWLQSDDTNKNLFLK